MLQLLEQLSGVHEAVSVVVFNEHLDAVVLKLFLLLDAGAFAGFLELLLVVTATLHLGLGTDEVAHLHVEFGLLPPLATLDPVDVEHQKQIITQNLQRLPMLEGVLVFPRLHTLIIYFVIRI
jgi:hypothetical protein